RARRRPLVRDHGVRRLGDERVGERRRARFPRVICRRRGVRVVSGDQSRGAATGRRAALRIKGNHEGTKPRRYTKNSFVQGFFVRLRAFAFSWSFSWSRQSS